VITCTIHEGRPYYETVSRGTRYTAYQSTHGWQVMTSRLALGPRHVPGVKHFKSVEEVAVGVKALKGLDLLVNADTPILN